jgi:hypothetical protein
MNLAREDLQEDYLRMAIDSFKLHRDQRLAYERWVELGDAGPAILAKVESFPNPQGRDAVRRYKEYIMVKNALVDVDECATLPGTDNNLCLSLWAGTTLLVIFLSAYFYLRIRPLTSSPIQLRFPRIKPPKKEVESTTGTPPIYSGVDESEEPDSFLFLKDPPLVNYIWSFVIGDDLFDESNSIDTAQGEFLGECGIEIANTLSDSTPKKVTAFDIWLFDKNEINTRSIILMSDRAFANDVLRSHFEMKGQPMKAIIGKEIEVKTDHLLMRMRVLDMICAQKEKGTCEYFQRLTLEVNIWQK